MSENLTFPINGVLNLGLGGKPFTVEAINHTDERRWFALARAS